MPRKFKFAILAVLLVFLAGVNMITNNPMAFAVFAGFALFATPWFLNMELFDIVDKYVDKHVDPSTPLELSWQIVYAILFGVIFATLWPTIVEFAVSNPNALVGDWLSQILPFEANQPHHPFWAVWAGATAFGGYLVEKFLVWRNKRAKKVAGLA